MWRIPSRRWQARGKAARHRPWQTSNPVLTVPGPSPGGRFYAGFPLWDGTGRILVSWTQCRILTTPHFERPGGLLATNLADPAVTSAPPLYSLWMFDPKANTLQPVMQPTRRHS